MSLRSLRQDLIDRTDLLGEAFCRAYSDAADTWLTGLFDQATGGDHRGMTLMAVGGYGRRELCPYSDLDVVLLHKGRRNISAIADRIWYPVWDEGVRLDHSVRRPGEVLDVANGDLRAALGLLDGRAICGDHRIADSVADAARERWVRQRPPWLDQLAGMVTTRHAAYGDVAFLLEPDLKESHGGLRDAGALRALLQARPALADYVDTAAIEDARATLTRSRVELHRRAGRELNKLLLQEQDSVAAALGETDADALMASVAAAGRTIAWESDDGWRRAAPTAPEKGRRRTRARTGDGPVDEVDVEPGVSIIGGEVTAAPSQVASDVALALRVAAVAAERRLPISRDSLNLLGRKAPAPPEPWPAPLRDLFVRVLAAGPPSIPALEALDQRQLLVRYLPEWRAVRNRPQRNAYHRFTVDRHLLETTANASALTDRVSRPDLLLVGALLHDIGKGYPGDHTEAGIGLVGTIATRMGFAEADVAVLQSMVRLHLLLPETATRRDLADPATAERVAKEVGDRTTLELLAALTEADSLATGPSAWGAWKAGLVAELVERTGQLLAGSPVEPPTSWVTDEHRSLMTAVRDGGHPTVLVDDALLTVVAPDRQGLLAAVTGVLALHGLDVRAADVAGEEGVAVERFVVEPSRGRPPAAGRIAEDVASVLDGGMAIDDLLIERAQTYRTARLRAEERLVTTVITVDNVASASASVVEVRARDVIGQLHRITRALADCDLDVITARVSTFGPAVVDAFYVQGPGRRKVGDATVIAEIEHRIRERIDAAERAVHGDPEA